MNKFAFLVVFVLFSTYSIFAKPDPKIIRNTLFKYKSLLNKNHNALYHKILQGIDFNMLSKGVPGLALCSVRCTSTSSSSNREMFIKSMAAVVNCLNKVILEHREFIKLVKKKRGDLSDKEKSHFEMICSFYQSKNINELLERVAPVPVSMAIAQAALESGFGSCEYMNSRNAVFGIMQTSNKLVEFDTVFEAAIAYAKTLNVNNCYKRFRKERRLMMVKSQLIDGAKLSGYIRKYSTNPSYQKHILSLIKKYSLASLDRICSF